MMLALIRSLHSQNIIAVDATQYFALGLHAVDCHTASGFAVSFQAAELDGTPFDVYSLVVSAGAIEESVMAGMETIRQNCNLRVDSIEIFMRDEWADTAAASSDTVGKNPVLVDAGPVGSAPAGTSAVTVTCGIAFRSTGIIASSLLIYVSDYPGLVGLSADESEIAAFRQRTTSELVR